MLEAQNLDVHARDCVPYSHYPLPPLTQCLKIFFLTTPLYNKGFEEAAGYKIKLTILLAFIFLFLT